MGNCSGLGWGWGRDKLGLSPQTTPQDGREDRLAQRMWPCRTAAYVATPGWLQGMFAADEAVREEGELRHSGDVICG